jgi:hypothetical protein
VSSSTVAPMRPVVGLADDACARGGILSWLGPRRSRRRSRGRVPVAQGRVGVGRRQ